MIRTPTRPGGGAKETRKGERKGRPRDLSGKYCLDLDLYVKGGGKLLRVAFRKCWRVGGEQAAGKMGNAKSVLVNEGMS